LEIAAGFAGMILMFANSALPWGGFDTCRDGPRRGIHPFAQDKDKDEDEDEDEASQDKPKSEVRRLNTAFSPPPSFPFCFLRKAFSHCF
jgi:hypothetical protein